MLCALTAWMAIGLGRSVSMGIGIAVFLMGWGIFTRGFRRDPDAGK